LSAKAESPNHTATDPRWEASTPEKLLRGPVIAGYIVVVLFFGGLGTWAALAPIASAVIATGVVSPEGSRKTIQHLEGGIITEILVEDGDLVQAGDHLVILQETQARAAFEVLQGQRQMLAAKLARLLAEQTGRNKITFPKWLLESKTPGDTGLEEILQAQADLFKARRKLHRGRKAVGNKRVDQLGEEIAGLKLQIKSQEEQLELIREETESKKEMLDRGMLPRPEYLALLRQKAEIEGDMAENAASIARLQQSIGETKLQVVNEDAVRMDQIVSEMAETRSELASVEERLNAQRDILERTMIVAPVSGLIMQKRFHTSGGVVGPGQPILDIVPQDAKLLIDAQVRPVDIDAVAPEQQARVHFLAFTQRNLPQIKGIVHSISADSLLDEVSGASYYLARVEVLPGELEKLGEDIKISAGMPAEVMIMSGERTLLQYLVQPVLDSLRRTFRES
jgi:HlyD family secretion protein/epimerase transport system membrane fusion protein